MTGLIVVSRHALVERADQGRVGDGFDYLRWRLAELRREVADDFEFWGSISWRDICLTRAAQLAEARGAQTTEQNRTPDASPEVREECGVADLPFPVTPAETKVVSS